MGYCISYYCKYCNDEIQQVYTATDIVWVHINNKKTDHQPEPKERE